MDNIVLFPKRNNKNIKLAYDAFEAQHYEEASQRLEALVENDIYSFEIHVKLITSLMKIKQFHVAKEYAFDFLDLYSGDQYITIAEMCIQIYFELNDYSNARMLINEVLEMDVAFEFRGKIQMLAAICYEQDELNGKKILAALEQAYKEQNYIDQWRLMSKWKSLHIKPDQQLATYLQHDAIHPMIKTNILLEFIKHSHSEPITINKFNQVMKIVPNDISYVWEQAYPEKLISSMEFVEQKDPTLFNIIENLVYHYFYVIFPFEPGQDQFDALQRAFYIVGRNHLALQEVNEPVDLNIATHIKNIQTCHYLYMSLHPESDLDSIFER